MIPKKSRSIPTAATSWLRIRAIGGPELSHHIRQPFFGHRLASVQQFDGHTRLRSAQRKMIPRTAAAAPVGRRPGRRRVCAPIRCRTPDTPPLSSLSSFERHHRRDPILRQCVAAILTARPGSTSATVPASRTKSRSRRPRHSPRRTPYSRRRIRSLRSRAPPNLAAESNLSCR